MDYLYIANDLLIWLDLYKGHIFLTAAIIDSFLVFKIAMVMVDQADNDKYINLHFKNGISKVNAIKIVIAFLAFVRGPGPRDTWVFATMIVFCGIVMRNLYLFVVINLKRVESKI